MTSVFPNKRETRSASLSYQALSHMLKESNGLTIGKGKHAFTLPSSATELLMEILSHLSVGNAVGLTTLTEEMTTQEAALLLNVSRPYVVSLLRKGVIPHRKVGNRMRVRTKDVVAYKERLFAEQAKAIEKMSAEAQKLKLGYA